MIDTTQEKEILSLIDDINNIALCNQNNYVCLNACKDALQLAYDIIEGKDTTRYLLKITKHGGKMCGIDSLSTYKKVCDTCNALKNNKNTICYKCYADKTLKLYKQLAPALIYNTLLLKYTKLSARQIPIINAAYFRFESFSDLQNAQHLQNLYKIARYNSACRFALWSKNIKLIASYKTPKNVNLIISSVFLNACIHDEYTINVLRKKTGCKHIKIFTVYDKNKIKDVSQNCSKSCLTCLKCYKEKDNTIFINEKLK